MLRRNLLVYGLGGIVAPFVGIKLIDLLVSRSPDRLRGDRMTTPRASPLAASCGRPADAPRPDGRARPRLPARRSPASASSSSPDRPTARSSAGRHGGRLVADRPVVRRATAATSSPAVRGRRRLRRARLRRQSNLGPDNADLIAAIEERAAEVAAELDGVDPDDVPADAVTATAPASTRTSARSTPQLQVARVAESAALCRGGCARWSTTHTAGATSASSASRA